MEALDKLNEIGAKEIAQETHIAINRVENILNKDFSALKDKTSTIGLVHILEREYKVDLKEWVSEYEEFLKANGEENEDLEGSIQLKITHEVTETRKDKGGIIIIAVILILCGIGFYVYNNFSNSLKQDENATEINTTAQINEENITQQNGEQNSPVSSENNQTLLPQVAEDLSSSAPINSPLQEAQETQVVEAPKIFELKPKGNMWIGIFYLDNHQKVSLTTDKPIEIDTKREQVFITGHGMLQMGQGENLQDYNQATKMRFYVDKEGNVSPINYAEYMRLSGGAGW